MKNKLRHIPVLGALVEVTDRTFQARHLLRPSPEANDLILGVFGRAASLYSVGVVCISFMSNHFHAIIRTPDAKTLAGFMGYLKGNLARELGRLHGWRGKLWARRYEAILISEEEAAQIARLKYLLAQGTKEGLVARPQDWPGVHCVDALLGEPVLRGTWYDRTAEYKARQRGITLRPEDYARTYELRLERLPCWASLSAEEHRKHIEALLEEIEREAAAHWAAEGIVVPGRRKARRAILRLDPHSAPNSPKRSPAPLFHAATREARLRMLRAYQEFVAAYRAAADELRQGNRQARFPEGCFPPPLPFVEATPGARTG